jgi:hypothetical protein
MRSQFLFNETKNLQPKRCLFPGQKRPLPQRLGRKGLFADPWRNNFLFCRNWPRSAWNLKNPAMDLPPALEAALAAAADALAEVAEASPPTWHAMCREEIALRVTTDQYWQFAGRYPETFPPELLVGARVLELLSQRHPLVLPDPELEGTA